MWLDIGVALVVITIIGIASFVLARSANIEVNKTFSYFSFITSIWIIANYVGANFKDREFAKYFIHADLLTGALLALSFWFFSLSLLRQVVPNHGLSQLQNRWRLLVSIVAIAVGLSTLYPWSLKVVTNQQHETIITYGVGFSLYATVLLLLLTAAICNSLLALRRSTGEVRSQLQTMIAGLAIAVSVVAVPNLLVPLFTSSESINLLSGNLAYAGIVIFVIATFYSIIVHKLFDLRLIVARTIAYTLSVSTFTLVYIGVTLLLSLAFIQTYQITVQQVISTALLILFVVVTINPVRRFFDKRTNRLFFRDAYESQAFLSQFNKVLVTNYDISPLLLSSSNVISEFLNPAFCVFSINQSSSRTQRVAGSEDHPHFTPEDLTGIQRYASDTRSKVILTDMLPDEYSQLQKILKANGVAILVRLTASVKDQGIGFLLLGNKKSGSTYSVQDVGVIEILADELVIAVQNAIRTEEIENFNITLQAKVDEATRKLRRTNEKLKALDEAKDDFVSMASHQLRTPLTSIKGYTSMVLEGDAGKINATQRKLLEQSYTSAQRMVYLIADLLNVSRLKTGKFIIEQHPVNIADMVEQEIGQLKETAAGRSLELTYEKPTSFPSLLLDETKTRQVIMNFIDNAIYYTPAGGHIAVKLLETPSSVEFRVVDDGIGVPKTEQPHLFTKFYRAGNARTARPDGTGLGLFMAKKVIIAQGGAIIFETTENKGSTFGFIFSKTAHKA